MHWSQALILSPPWMSVCSWTEMMMSFWASLDVPHLKVLYYHSYQVHIHTKMQRLAYGH